MLARSHYEVVVDPGEAILAPLARAGMNVQVVLAVTEVHISPFGDVVCFSQMRSSIW